MFPEGVTGAGEGAKEPAICDECIAAMMSVMAATDKKWFNQRVREARAYKPGEA